tara:strand:- start:71434 stop:72216 length:783 start_codon:yes stop_codon:yes gene_type:complete
MNEDIKRISYSEYKNWHECPYRHKLIYIDKLPYFSGNEYTAFGTAIHKACEEMMKDQMITGFPIFEQSFKEELEILQNSGYDANESLIKEMKEQAQKICKCVIPAINNNFTNYELVSVEEPLLEDIKDFNSYDRKFKGFIDLVIKTKDQYHIIDWKTCSWGWPSRKKTDKIVTSQLSLYKKFYSDKHNIDSKKINTYFVLLKRTASKENVEIVKVSSGDKKVKNSLKLLENAVINIERKVHIKNRLSCKYCKFYKTKNCE